jgi:hypothetical protein
VPVAAIAEEDNETEKVICDLTTGHLNSIYEMSICDGTRETEWKRAVFAYAHGPDNVRDIPKGVLKTKTKLVFLGESMRAIECRRAWFLSSSVSVKPSSSLATCTTGVVEPSR